MRVKAILILLFVLGGMALKAQNSPEPIDIVQLEYYLNYNPDTATAVNLGIENSPDLDIDAILDLSDLPTGLNMISIRVKDSTGIWSHLAHRFIYKLARRESDLTHLCYLFDQNPGTLQSIPLSQSSLNAWFLEGSIQFPFGSTAGWHTLSTWVVDTSGIASHTCNRIIYHTPQTQHHLTQFRWYFTGPDANPELLYTHDLQAGSNDITEDLILSLPDLTPNEEYCLHFSAISEDGTPSHRASYSFTYHFQVENLTINLAANTITLAWDAIPNAVRYRVERKSDPLAEGTWVETSNNTISLQASGDKEFFRVKAEK